MTWFHFGNNNKTIYRKRNKDLGVPELIAIALGGMVGGGIFTILGISVAMVGVFTPIAIAAGGLLAALAAYSYVKLGVYYQDEGATYSFYKKTFPKSPFAASLIGWWVIFGYISTMALYAFTFASYALSGLPGGEDPWMRKAVAGLVLLTFMLINVWSVKGMGKIEDWMVYTKLVLLVVISFVLINNSRTTLPVLLENNGHLNVLSIFIISALTFVAYEGFQLVTNAVDEMDEPEKNIPKAVYAAIALAVLIYVIIAVGAILTIPFADIIQNKEYALAAGTKNILGHWGSDLIIIGALLATSSAISGTVFGASRQMAVIAEDGYFPKLLARRRNHIPTYAIIAMSLLAFALIVIGNLQVIVEFGSVTFILVSLLMAFANHKIRKRTNSSVIMTTLAFVGLMAGLVLIVYYEATTQVEQLFFIGGLYLALTIAATLYSFRKKKRL